MVVSLVGSLVAVAGNAVSDAGQRIDPNGVLGASCKAVGDTVEAFGCKCRDSLRDLEADCMHGVGLCVKAATFGAMGAGIVAASVAYRAATAGGAGEACEAEPSVSPANNREEMMAKLQEHLGVQSCEAGQEVSAQNTKAAGYEGPERRQDGAYRSRAMDEYFSKDRGQTTEDA